MCLLINRGGLVGRWGAGGGLVGGGWGDGGLRGEGKRGGLKTGQRGKTDDNSDNDK